MRSIREENAARLAVDEAAQRWSRAGDAWDALTWVIAREPELGTAINESGTMRAYTLDGVRSLELPTVTVLYEITDEAIVIHDARFTEAIYGSFGRA